MTGIAIKNENLAAAGRVNPTIRPAEMVIPEREVPGISAKTWAAPIINTSFHEIDSMLRCFAPSLSVTHKTSPKTNLNAAKF